MQVEEAYIGAEEFCKRLKQDPECVLNTEPLALSGLKFDLITFSPYTSLSGYFRVSPIAQGPFVLRNGRNKRFLCV